MRRLLLALALAPILLHSSSLLAEGDKRLVNLGLAAAENVDPKVERTLEDTVASHVDGAAKVRGYDLVPLRRVLGLEEEAARCSAKTCRGEILRRLAAHHGLSGTLERRARGYRVSFWLEDAASGELIRAVRLEGEVPELVGGLRAAVEEVLEAGSSKEAVARDRLAKTARAYLDKQRADDAVRTYRRAIDVSPFHPEAAKLFVRMLDVLERGDDEAPLVAAASAATEMYGPRSAWARAGIGGEESQRAIERSLRALFARRGTKAHKEALALSADAEADKRRARLEEARAWYRRYLFDLGVLGDDGKLPEEDREAAEIAFYLGEVAYELAAFDEAARAYEAARESSAAPQREDAAVNALFSLEKAIVAEGSFDPSAPPAISPSRREAPPLVARYVESAERLATLFPKHPEAPAFLYRAASAELHFGHKDDAKALLERLVQRSGKTKAGRAAKELLTTLR